ncbi:MAG: immune inhibitor A, partial [Chloroflexi bacterium]|nr:immune inhibitor A [Chloroflexota bacterium]
LHDQYGGEAGLADLVAEAADGEAGVDAFLARRSPGRSFESTFLDWVVANALDSPQGSYGYPNLDVRIVPRGRLEPSAPRSEQVHQYGARYYELPEDLAGARLVFTGTTEARLFPAEPRSGQTVWWSQRGDAIDSTLTREFDLTGVTEATLTFWTWYDIEQGYDWAYVEVSTDGGRTWDVLAGGHATTEDPIGNSYGPAYTGSSGAPQRGWVQEAIDLSPFTGQRIQVRFEYVTDEAVNLRGLFLDDIALPQVGFLDDAEQGDLWEAQGFVRAENRLPQRFSVRFLYGGEQVVVTDVPLDPNQSGHATIPPRPAGTQRAYVAVAALAPLTLEPAPFTLAVENGPP